MSNEVAKIEPKVLSEMRKNVMTMPEAGELIQFTETAKLLSTCPYYQKLGPGGVLAIWLTAREMGLPPMTCLNGGMYTFSGAVTLSSQIMNMMIVKAGHRVDILTLNENKCHLRFHRSDRSGEVSNFEYEYTMEMAQNAGLANKDNWKKNKRDMLFSRALSGGARKFMPDVIMNAYVHGEIIEEDESPRSITQNSDQNHIQVKNICNESSNSVLESKDNATKVIQPISEMEAEELGQIMSQCSPEFKSHIATNLLKRYNFTAYSDLPRATFEKALEQAKENKEQYQASLNELQETADVPF
jgi:hypothetical protein